MKTIPLKAVLTGLLLAVTTLSVSECAGGSAAEARLVPDKDLVVLLHGLGRSPAVMWLLASRLEDAGFQTVRVGYASLQDTPGQILADVSRQINACCVRKTRQVHFVGHSLGGLLVRAYLKKNRVPNLGRAVLLGTPNGGTAIVDKLRGSWWFDFLGPTAKALGTDARSFPRTLDKPNYPVGVIAGKVDNDNEGLLPGEDDGLVAVASTKFDGLTDFVVVETGHSAMRYHKGVANYTIRFLRTGTFSGNASRTREASTLANIQ